MKPKTYRPTLRQRIVADLTKRMKVIHVQRPHYEQWHVELDGECLASGRRDAMRDTRRELIPYYATKQMRQVADLRAKGFKVTLPS